MEPDKKEAEIQRVGLRRQGERHKITCAHGELPRDFIGKFTSRRAFIYMMEIWAAVMAVVFTQEELPPYFFMFVDNQAGKSNAIITAFWTLTSHRGWFPAFKYVKSELDPIGRHDTSMAQAAGWTEKEVDTSALLRALESFAQDPNGSISKLLSVLLALSGLGIVHGVVRSVHNQPSAPEPTQPTS